MEEGEQDLEKLTRWLAKIQARVFFPAEHRQFAATMMVRCRSALSSFSQAVYIAEGVEDSPAARNRRLHRVSRGSAGSTWTLSP
jgi:hypothetical protein